MMSPLCSLELEVVQFRARGGGGGPNLLFQHAKLDDSARMLSSR